MTDEQELVRVSNAARQLDCSRRYVYVLVKRGILESKRLGGRTIRITKDSLERLIARGSTE